MTLGELIVVAARDLPGIETTTSSAGDVSWSRGGRPFASVTGDGSTAEFDLDPAVAAAAVRTQDVASSERGPGWVTLAPTELDEHAADRGVAWLASAHRRLGPRD